MVSTHGPMAVQKSLPLDGPMPIVISKNWISRALTSLKIVTPAMQSAASAGVRSRPPREVKNPSSSSKSSWLVYEGHSSGSSGPMTVSTLHL